MSGDSSSYLQSGQATARPDQSDHERAVRCFFTDTGTSRATSSAANASTAFSIAQIVAGTGLDRRTVIEVCAALSDGWAREDVPPGREPLLVPMLVPVGDCDGSDIHFALYSNGSAEGEAS